MVSKKPKNIDQFKNILKLLKNSTRFQIFLLLLQQKSLSHTELSRELGLTKSTISTHMKKMASTGLIRSRKVPAKGSIDAKEYEINNKILTHLFEPLKSIPNLPLGKKLEMENHLFSFVKVVYDHALANYERQSPDYAIEQSILFLTQEEYQNFKESSLSWSEVKKGSVSDSSYLAKTHIVFLSSFPIEDLIEKKGFKAFQEALEGKNDGGA